ncbi:uncharacterized protein LOC128553084 [Mercenaria mercenaria]|uniref:uncharacterized protein LOC128553084 n=1 Tax=Mercenaria mercenaria TaxID=6596 RepID=UPI00234EBF0E|nr:uncharacterized protein LOC128553084 [Mercenaria mercenaria]
MASDGINTFTECVTLAQVCYCAHRKNTLPEKSLGIISDAGYPNKTRYSIKGVRWLQAEATTTGKPIRHALNGGEVRIGPYSVNGYNAETNTVYEFLGCWTHGCETCYPKREVKNTYSLKTMNTLYLETFSRLENLQNQGYRIKYIWECTFDQTCKENPEYKSLIDRFYPHMEPIKPRDALFGGRTNAVTLYHEVDESTNQEIKYADICSLYPYVNKYKEYPLHHPVILSQEGIDMTNLKQYRSLVKCKVLPPRDLWLPVLPMHCNKKMVYTLCRTCAEKELQTCTHSQEERVLVGVWTSVELNKALDLGYKILEVYQIWHFKEWSDTVYKEYINKYLKRKQEASGYPNWVKTQAEKDKFKSDYFQAEGVSLEDVEKNPGKRAVAKTMLNCLWGKNAQNNVLPKSEYIDKPARLYEIMSDPHKKVHYFDFFEHDEFSLINYSDYTDMSEPHAAANV